MILYNLHGPGPTYAITKFDENMDVMASYEVSAATCSCPSGSRPSCRHRQMLPLMASKANTAWFYCFDDHSWHDPMGTYAFADEDEALARPPEPAGPTPSPIVSVPSTAIRRRV